MLVERVKGKTGKKDVQTVLDYETHELNPQTGEVDYSQPGGLMQLQELFDGRIHSTGRFFESSILYAAKQLGCKSMMGLGSIPAAHQCWLVHGYDGHP